MSAGGEHREENASTDQKFDGQKRAVYEADDAVYYSSVLFQYANYNNYLSELLEQTRQRRPGYSLRAMAKQIGVSPATLSDVISGKKHFSETKALEVSNKLKLSAREARYFCALVQYQSTKSEEMRALLAAHLRTMNPRLRNEFEVTVDRFNLMAEWYHMAILEMTYLEETRMHVDTIAKSLGITALQAQGAIDLLVRLNLIEALGNGRYRKTHGKYLVQSGVPDEALRKYHHKMLELAQESLVTQTPAEKAVGSETLPLDSADLAEAKEIIETCFQQIIQLSERAKKKDHVFHLGIQLFRLTERRTK